MRGDAAHWVDAVKIMFQDEIRNRAALTRGWWRWKRVAIVARRETPRSYPNQGFTDVEWYFESTGRLVDDATCGAIEEERKLDKMRAHLASCAPEWSRIQALPQARSLPTSNS